MLTSLFGDLRTPREDNRDESFLVEERDRGFSATPLLEHVDTEVNARGQMVDRHQRDLVVDGSPAQAIRDQFSSTRADLDSASRQITLYDPTGVWAAAIIKGLSDASGRAVERLHLREQGTLRTLAMIERTSIEQRKETLRIYHADVRAPGTDNAAIPMALMESSQMTAVIVGSMHPHAIDEMLLNLLRAVQQPQWRCPALLFMLPPSAVWIANKIGMIAWPARLRVQALNESLTNASSVWNSLLGIWNHVKSAPAWEPPAAPDTQVDQIKVADLRRPMLKLDLGGESELEPATLSTQLNPDRAAMALDALASLDGVLGCAVVDADTGLILAQQARVDVAAVLALAAAASTQALRSHQQLSRDMGLLGEVDEVMTSAGSRHHVMRSVSNHRELFLFALLDKQRTNLALARYKMMEAEQSLS